MIGKGGKFIPVVAVNPPSVCCEEALLATALLTVGVPEHPQFHFSIRTEENAGLIETRWQWLFGAHSANGQYATSDLIKWWNDRAWLAANAQHEWSILARSLRNMGEVARRIRETIPRIVLRRGDRTAHIPATASPARKAHLIGQLEGRIPLNATFVEPEPQPAQPA